jgi:putative transcriptional regulator
MAKKSKHVEPLIDVEMRQFQDDLLQSVREFKAGKFARVTQIEPTMASKVRQSVGVTQAKFAALLGVSVRTLQEWEQGRREPTGAAKTLLAIALRTPEALRAVV